MSSETKTGLLAAIDRVRFNPSAIQRIILDQLGEGIDVVDPTNPFTLLLESASLLGSACMAQSETLVRQIYPSLAQTDEELYRHMADADYLDRFASPARTSFTLLLGKEELYSRAVATGIGNTRKLVIPRHTEFTVAGYKFTMQYPVEIRIMGHGGLQVVYDVSSPSPLETLESNTVDWTIVTLANSDFLRLELPAAQFEITPYYNQLNPSTGFVKDYPLKDNYYFCRVYASQPDGSWQEIRTTHSDQVFDIGALTAVLRVQQGTLRVTIPQVYFTTGLAERELRIDIYTTKGPMDLILGNYGVENFTARWLDRDSTDGGRYSAPLSNYTTLAVYSDKSVVGGRNALSFEELRDRVMMNAAGAPSLPITGAQVEARLSSMGYEVVKNVDNITNRIYWATRRLPPPTDGSLTTGAGCTIATMRATMEQLEGLETVRDNGQRLTLLPQTLYEWVGGLVEIVPHSRVRAIEGMSAEARATEVNGREYLYSPFHYVLDASDNGFDCRPYYMDRPAVEGRTFVQENDTAEIEVSTGSYTLEQTASGYRLLVQTLSGESFQALADDRIHVQLSFQPTGESDRAYINGTLIETIDGERVFEFRFDTRYDIDRLDRLLLTSFKMYDLEERRVASRLLEDFDLIYIVAEHQAPNMEYTEIDQQIGRFLLPNVDLIGVVQERFRLRFGHGLSGLWARSRSLMDSYRYLYHETDEPLLYEEDVFERDPVTGTIKITYDADTGQIQYNRLHRAGDPVLDVGGSQVYKHRKGDVVLDGEGRPVTVGERAILRQFDMLFIDAIHRFANEASSVRYRDSIAQMVVDWVTRDIRRVSQLLLENTRMYFYPKVTFGEVEAYVKEGVLVSMNAEQSFTVRYYMNRVAYDDLSLRAPLTETATQVISEALKKPTISTVDITSKIAAVVGEDILAVEVLGLGGAESYSAVTLKDSSSACSLRKRLQVLPNGQLGVQDDVIVEFIRHID